MSSFIYPNSHIRKLFGCGAKSYTVFLKKRHHRESMMEAARRRTAERLAQGSHVIGQKTFFQKVKSKVANFLSNLFK
jgi:hypothetical protein